MPKLVAGALIAVIAFISLGINFNPCNDPVLIEHYWLCKSNTVVIDYAANGGSHARFDYDFSVYRVQDGQPDLKIGTVTGPGLPRDQRYVVSVPLRGPNGLYENDPWPDDTSLYITINSSGPNNRTLPQVCQPAEEPKKTYHFTSG